ncbi:MAG: hypothetical protein AB9873_17745 [Syntrophobacteraceae bacterium]
MKLLLYVLAVLASLGGFSIFGASKSAIHEIEAFVLFVVSAIFLVGAVISGKLDALRQGLNPIEEKLGDQSAIEPAKINKVTNEKAPQSNRAPGGTCPNCSSQNTESLRLPDGIVYSVRCHDCLRTFKS